MARGNLRASFTRGISGWQYAGQRDAAAAIHQFKRVPRFKASASHRMFRLIFAEPRNVTNGGKFFNNASRMGHGQSVVRILKRAGAVDIKTQQFAFDYPIRRAARTRRRKARAFHNDALSGGGNGHVKQRVGVGV